MSCNPKSLWTATASKKFHYPYVLSGRASGRISDSLTICSFPPTKSSVLGFWPSSLEGHVERAASSVFLSHLRAISFEDEWSNYQGIKHISPPPLQLASCI